MSIEELLGVEVTSVSRREEVAADAATSIHVITQEDIRRSGARSIPEALRLAPNLQVAKASARSWAISARGFKAPFSNKLLVMIDGRSVYSALFSGVFWDAQDTVMEDIERIEVISGPGATVWGANAVNGVINIITKDAGSTHGALAAIAAGNKERVSGTLRYGSQLENGLNYRVYAKYFDRDESVFSNGDAGSDAWHSGQAGFRLDWTPDETTAWTVQGDIYDGRGDQVDAAGDIEQSGANLLARWTRTSLVGRLQLQAYYDHTRQFVAGDFGDELDTFDVDAQYGREVGRRHYVTVGAGYRLYHDEAENLPGSVAFLPAELDRHLFSAFVQDEIALSDHLRLVIGSKFEHNDYTGFEIQPSGRIAWDRGRDLFWAAVSRAVRTPSRFDRHLFFPAEPPFFFAGGPAFDSEKMIAYEAGWRMSEGNTLASVAAFYNDYDDIRSTSPAPPFVTENNVEGEIHGIELDVTWQVTGAWRLSGGYTLLQEDLRVKPGRADLNAGEGETFDPEQQLQLRSSLTLGGELEIDLAARYVDRIGSMGRGFGVLPDYVTLDARVGWSPVPHLEVSLAGQNLLQGEHPEFGTREVERSVYGMVTARF